MKHVRILNLPLWIILSICIVMAVSTGARAATGEVLASFPTPSTCPTGLAFDGANLWLADWVEAKLYRIDPATGDVIETMKAPGYHPSGLACMKGFIFVADSQLARIFKLDPRTKEVVASYAAPGRSPVDLAADAQSLYLLDDRDDTIYRLNPDDGTTLGYYKAPHEHCRGLTYDGEYLWASERMNDEIYMLNPEDGMVFMVLKSPGPYPTGMAFDGKNLWIADFEKDRIFKLAWRDNEKYTVKDTKRFRMTFRHLLRNTGSGTIKSAKAFLAVPDETQENLKILEPLEFDPKPSKMDRDRWGQEVAVFEFKDVAPGKETRAEYRTEIEIGELNFLIFPDKAGTLDEIPSEIREKYTADGSRYRIKDPIIADTAREIVGKERNAYRVGRKIFQWVIEKLEYEMVGGWDAPEVLIKRGTGSCSEYAFLYIALCHAAGLPARYEGSVAQRGDNASIDDVFHRWCEIYLPGYGWIPVDPSGGDQKWPADQARYFGHLRNKYFVTTRGAGDSEYLGWNYNYNSEYTYEGQGDVYEEAWGLWEPITDEKEKVTGGSEAACP